MRGSHTYRATNLRRNQFWRAVKEQGTDEKSVYFIHFLLIIITS